VRKAVTLQLEDWGFRVFQAATAAEGIATFDPDLIEAVVASVTMNDSGGLAVLDEVRVRSTFIPVIMLVGSPSQEHVIAAMRRGAFDFIILDEIHIIRRLVHGERFVEDRPDPLEAAMQRAVNQTRLMSFGVQLNSQLTHANEALADERQRLQETLDELRSTQANLVRAEKAAGLAAVSHGVGNAINNPLVVLKTNFELLTQWIGSVQDVAAVAEMPLAAEVPDLIEDCRSGLERIKTTVEALARFANNREVMFEPVDVCALLHNLPPYLDEELADRADLEVCCTMDQPVRASRLLLQQAVLGILSNSLEACCGNHRVWLRAEVWGEAACVVIADDGEGIEASDLSHVLDPFFTTRLERKAHGLGLSLANELVTQMGGELQIESQVGRGTTVTVRLPLWQRHHLYASESAAMSETRVSKIQHPAAVARRPTVGYDGDR
jgi:signal transduction histidine kinase